MIIVVYDILYPFRDKWYLSIDRGFETPCIKFSKVEYEVNIVKKKVRKKITNTKTFQEDMKNQMEALCEYLHLLNNDDQAAELVKNFNLVYDKHAPWKEISINLNKKSRPKLKPETISLMKQRNHAKKEMKEEKSQQSIEKFKKLRNKATNAVRRDRQINFEQQLKSGKHVWKTVNEYLDKSKSQNINLVENGEKINTEKETAQILNNFFIEKIQKLREKIDPKLQTNPVRQVYNKGRLTLECVNESDVEHAITQMKNSNSHGNDGVSANMLKTVAKEVSKALTIIINTSITTGNFPSVFKCAVVTPIFKQKGKKEEKENYRPIAGLSVFGKVQENIIEKQMRKFCEEWNLFGEHQHGFRASRSTTTAVLSSTNKWRSSTLKNKHMGVLLFDLSAAYDTLDPKILIDKARKSGFDDLALAWLKSYLTGRKQRVKVGNELSEEKELTHGIPQGSCISCMLFLLYTGDVVKWVKRCSISTFADDTMIYADGSDPEKVIEDLENEAKNLFCYFSSNNLVANPSKTAFMMFRPKNSKKKNKLTINLQGNKIVESESERILGIQVRNDFEWEEHAKKVIKRVNHGLYTLRRCQQVTGTKNLKIISSGLVSAHINYGSSVYLHPFIRIEENDPKKEQMKTLQKYQNVMLRTVLKVKVKDKVSIKSMLDKTGNLSINQMACLNILMDTWKSVKLNIKSLKCDFVPRENARNQSSFKEPNDKNSFIYKAIKLWNKTSIKFKTTNLTKVAKKEAMETIRRIPI